MEQIALDMEFITESELDIYAQNLDGATPLHLAARHLPSIKKEKILVGSNTILLSGFH